MNKQRWALALGLMAVVSGCRREVDDLGVGPVSSVFVSAQSSGRTSFIPAPVVLTNPIGGFIVTGAGIAAGEMNWRLDKFVRVSERSLADVPLSQMTIRNAQSAGDSLRVAISTPLSFRGPAGVTAFVELPYDTPLRIAGATDSTIVSYLTGDLKIRSSRGVQVVGQSGSCDIRVEYGGADVQIAPPDGGQIVIEALSGNITVHMPPTISAQIDALADKGSIKTQGFVFLNAVRSDGVLNGTINGGAGRIRLRARTGEIFLTTIDR